MKFIGILVILAGVLLGLYVGLWVCFIGGIIAVVEAFKHTPVESLDVALGIVRVVGSSFCGAMTFFFCAMISAVFFKD